MKWVRVDTAYALNARKKFHTVSVYPARMNAVQNVGQRCSAKAPITTIYLKRKWPRSGIRKANP